MMNKTFKTLSFVIVALSVVWACYGFGYTQEQRAGERMVLTTEGVEYPFRWCPAGTFMMGSPEDEKERESNETQHQVTLTSGFWLLETPVTQAMWKGVMGSNSGAFQEKNFPVNCVSWTDCQAYVEKLNALKLAPSGYRFSLPTEAQWEYACRAGTTTPFHFGIALNGDKANCTGHFPYGTTTKGTSLDRTSEVGAYPANAWGLFDMHGNVWEWCLDWKEDYPAGEVTDPVGPVTGAERVIRGGSWCSSAGACRSAYRYSCEQFDSHWVLGLRLVIVCE
ncbi:MAG: formylglycine-generating enzyme family protein [Planctomycetaceae bacterium]|nr:formylglycine-generating enzyme family protein [Planctomycetaceae bacterium]